MSTDAQRVLSDALSLCAPERALLAESLLESLDRPDATVDSLWAREAEERLAAELKHMAEWLGLESVLVVQKGDLAADLAGAVAGGGCRQPVHLFAQPAGAERCGQRSAARD